MNTTRVLPLLAVAIFAGCGDPDHLVQTTSSALPFERIPTDVRAARIASAPEEVVEAWVAALEARDHEAYENIIRRDFEFCVREDDIGAFPWLSGECWSRREELRMIRNMTNPDHDGQQPPVTSIEVDVLNLQVEDHADFFLVTADVTIVVLVAPDTGWLTDTRLEFTVIPSPSSMRIGTMRERQILLREETSWGAIKALYRS